MSFQAGKRLASVSDPSGRDVFAGNNHVLEGIGFDFLGDIAVWRLKSKAMDKRR